MSEVVYWGRQMDILFVVEANLDIMQMSVLQFVFQFPAVMSDFPPQFLCPLFLLHLYSFLFKLSDSKISWLQTV